jgi:anti-sigma B factor antagonist
VTDVTSEPIRDALRPPGPVQFQVTELHREGVIVLTVEGELDLLTAPKLAARLSQNLRGGEGDVVLDLRSAQFIDSAGLATLLNIRRRLQRRSRRLQVLCDDGPVRRVIEMARLEEPLGLA